jgi:hypothetical protein
MLFTAYQILTVLLIAVAFGMAVAHVLELPGKMRLGEIAYLNAQRIYYPGFTIGGGVGEAGGIIATVILLLLTPRGSIKFWLVLLALAGLVGMQVIFWVLTQPVNKYWMQGQKLNAAGQRFFSSRKALKPANQPTGRPLWIALRNRWELSHAIRAICALVSFLAIVTSIATQPR